MPEQEHIELRAIVYSGLWAPLMIRGVPRDWLIFSSIIGAIVMLIAGLIGLSWFQAYGIGTLLVMAAIGFVWAKFDPEFFSITLGNLKIGKTKGSRKDVNEYLP